MAHPPFIARLANFNQDALANLESPAPLSVDSELNQLVALANLINLRLRNITNADGTLRNQSTATAQALAGAQRFVATASQTLFTTTIAWSASFTSLNVEAFSGGTRIDSSLISVADSGGFLAVTLPAQTVSTVVLIAAFESGAGILTRLGTAGSATDGANLVAIRDAGGWFVSSTTEGALQELGSDLDALTTSLGSIGGLIRADGTVPMAANLAMGSFKITGLANGTASTDAVTVGQLSAYTAVWNALQSYFLRLDGTTPMGANLPMGAHKITGLANGTASTDAVAIGQLASYVKTDGTIPMAADLAMGTHKITGLSPGVSGTDAVNKNQLDAVASAFSGFSTFLADITAAGTSSVTIPAGVTTILIEAWGAGGGGGSGAAPVGGGGGAGAVRTVQTVVAGDSLVCVVGAGGAAGAAGGDTTVTKGATVFVTAKGGKAASGGTQGGSSDTSTFNGSNGVQFTGGRGGPGLALSSSTFGMGGQAAMGGGAGGEWGAGGVAGGTGIAPGGGGAGNQVGAAGRIIIRY